MVRVESREKFRESSKGERSGVRKAMMELVRWTETEKKQEKSGEKRKINGANGAKKLKKKRKRMEKKRN